jgi:TatD DNase family protein
MPKYFDVHTHVQFEAFNEDRQAVLERLKESETWIINVGTQKETSRLATELAETVPEGIYATVGLHPTHTGPSYHDTKELGKDGEEFTRKGEVFEADVYKSLAQSNKVVAIGESGLDYFRLPPESKEKQKEAFIQQIHLANEVGKPLMLHIRPQQGTMDAYEDALVILGEWKKQWPAMRGTTHFFAGTKEIARQFLDLGFHISFSGIVTIFPEYEEVVRYVPLDRILPETDAPFAAPVPYRGTRNESAYVVEVVKKIAELKNLSVEETEAQLLSNVKELFGI